ncbi:EAL domain-containing protein [Methylophilus sp.]|uniref:bifunctional diguanylate cyclase/phosphodiesterase n=1 Tax=Methylophilus sp. TaxID=29541 RepID=UPI000D4DE55E|nr:EAL domain-containing protein [Methylophilus sp.]PPD11380.1 MAG: GGDEF domain-containing protein [Methylophilus sp.]
MIKFKHIRSRIAFTFLTVVVAIQLAGLIPLKYALVKHANTLAEDQIDVGQRVFVSLLQHNTQSLKQATQVLAADFAFREAVATNDAETIESALESYQGRIRAQIAFYISNDENLVVGTSNAKAILKSLDARQAIIQSNAGTLQFDIVDDKPYQLITVPVKAPETIGWIVMGFAVDSQLASQINQLTHLDVTFVQKTNAKDWQLVSSTADKALSNLLLKTVADLYRQRLTLHSVDLNDQTYHLKIRALHETPDEALLVVLQGSVAPFTQDLNMLFKVMLVLTLIGVVIFAVLIWYVSRKTTEPIAELVKDADKIAMGDYETEIQVSSTDEVGYLAKAMNSMREAVLQRSLRIQRLAFNDELTGLSNRLAFNQGVHQAISTHADTQQKLSVIVINIHRFKPINQTLGRDFGDDLLRHVGQVLKQHVLSEQDMVARLDADEFAVLLQHTDQAKATRYADKIQQVFEQPVSVQGQAIDVRTGIGIALYPDHGVDEEALLNHAETALQESRAKKSPWIVYNTALEIDQSETLTLISDLKQAIQHDQLLLYIQPKIDITTRRAVGGEALIRWVHPEKGMIFPDQFIPFAEQTGVISDITNWMLLRACQVLADFQKQGLRLSLAVNLSTRDLNNMQLPAQIAHLLSSHGLEAKALKLEITEGSLMQDPERAELVVKKLAAMGLHLAIDDFGTGYSSLAYLRQLPVQELKIDRSFVMFMDKNSGDASIVKSTIDLAHNLGLMVVAEGIENEYVLNQLARLGCNEGQGYFIGKPMPEKDFSIWLQRWEGQNEIEIDIGDDLSFAINPLEDNQQPSDPFKLDNI